MRGQYTQRPDGVHEATMDSSLGLKSQKFKGEAAKISKDWIIMTLRSFEESGFSMEGDGHLWKTRTRLGKNLFLCEPGQRTWPPRASVFSSVQWRQKYHKRMF